MSFLQLAKRNTITLVIGCLLFWGGSVSRMEAQNLATGSLTVTVRDPSGAVINGAQLTLTDIQTNNVRKAKTSGAGNATIPYLNPALYSLTVSHGGFKTKIYPSVTIDAGQVTNIAVAMEVGAATQTVMVSAAATPLLQTSSDTLSTTINLKEVQDLPVYGRNAFSLAFLVPGAVGNNFDNLPGGAVNVSNNGFSTMTNRFKSGGFDSDGSTISNQIQNVQQFTVQTSQLGANHGGTSTMDIGFVTKRGTNHFHGMVFEDLRNTAMNANSWYNNAVGLPRSIVQINDFGGSIGGPFIRNKFFFYASLANFREPFNSTVSTTIGTPLALSGIYEYIPQGSATVEQDNVLQAGASAGCSTCTATINPLIEKDLQNIESTYHMPGVTLTPVDLNHESLNFLNKGYTVDKYPTLRLDYNISPNLRWTGSASGSFDYVTHAGGPPYPGPLYSSQAYSYVSRGYQATTGLEWNIAPTLLNSFSVGYLYTGFTYNSQGINIPTAAMVQQGDLAFGFGLNSGVNGFASLKGGSLYPVLGLKDNVSWQHGRHNFEFGVSTSTEVDHYYNNQFVPYIGVNYIATGDPVTSALVNSLPANAPSSAASDVEGLYATLNGRMTYYSLGEFVNTQSKQFEPGISFNLHERLTQSALFAMDSWHVTPELTVNYGLRWDFTGASHDETGFYTHPTVPDMWGPTPVGALFQPGNLGGVQNPVEKPGSTAYAPTYFHPEPNVGFAWNPRGKSSNWFYRLMGNGKTVIRAGYSLTNYTEGAQNFWNFGSNFGANFNTYFTAFPVAPGGGAPGRGFYDAGSLQLGDQLPPLGSTSPVPYNPIIPEASQTFSGTSFFTFDPHIKQPYVESWTVGIQRALSRNNVLEMRYVGNVSRDQWLGVNYNEINIFENGFLNDFRAAQANLALSGGTTFQGPHPTPILTQAFQATGENANFTNGQFITWLQQGQAGAFANALAGNPSYLCSLVGAANFSPCQAVGATGGGSYPINFFEVNPYAAGAAVDEMTNDGYSNYNALQIDFRQHLNHGMEFDVNYTWSHSLANNVQGSISPGAYGGGGNATPLGPQGASVGSNAAPTFYTLRDKRLNYFPSSFDVPDVLHASGIYELPFGHDREFFNKNRVANYAIGGWTIGMILSYESGEPFLFFGGTEPFNTNDGGITLTGVTRRQLQSQIKARRVPGHPWVSLFNSKYIAASGQANYQYISPNFQAGTIGRLIWLHSPKWINTDLALTKVIPIHKGISFTLQGEFLNAFNHPAWTGMDTGLQDTTFGTTNETVNQPRNVEVRGTLRF